MGSLQTLGFLLGASFASGLNLYATVSALGLLHRFEVVKLPAQLEVLANPWVLGTAIVLYIVEFVADKVPWFDSAWDVLHTFIRPPAAAVLAYTAVGTVPEHWKIAAGLLAGTVALTSHGAKATTRAAANTSPEPFSNWILSFAEDAIAIFLSWLAVTHPLLAIFLAVVLLAGSVLLIYMLFSVLRAMFRRLFRRSVARADATTAQT
jgi:hypothetical protein